MQEKQRAKQFIFNSFSIDEARKELTFCYTIVHPAETYQMHESLVFPCVLPDVTEVNKLAQALHIALGISYYKTFFAEEMVLKDALSQKEADFWNTVYRQGLGEFLYKNNLDGDLLAKFKGSEQAAMGARDYTSLEDNALLGIGGGKDSIVAGEIMKKLGLNTRGFVVATGTSTGQSKQVADVMEFQLDVITRQIDMSIVELNSHPDAYNGHIPISVVFALCGCLLAVAEGRRYVVVGNESSASIPHTSHNGVSVNHQWSKSLEFEKLFQNYVQSFVNPSLHYFSLIRPLSSLAVAKIFAKFPDYLEVFSSDNTHFKHDTSSLAAQRWTTTSVKSLSSYILLSPWIEKSELLRAFGHDFLNDMSLTPTFKKLLGADTEHPVLDCVGTPEELQKCIRYHQMHDTSFSNDALVVQSEFSEIPAAAFETLFDASFELTSHAFPESLGDQITDQLRKELL